MPTTKPPPQTKPATPTLEELLKSSPKSLEKVISLGIHTVEALANANVFELDKADIDKKDALRIITKARACVEVNFISASQLMEERKENIWYLKTGVPQFDDMIGGGLESQSILEVYGEYGSGKSVLGHQLAVQCTEQKGSVLWFDTEGGFRPEWIINITKPLKLDPKNTLSKILVAKVYNSDHQILLMEKTDGQIKDNDIKLIVIDSLMAHFRSEYYGRDLLAPRQQRLNYFLNRTMRHAKAFNIPVYLTNQVLATPDAYGSTWPQSVGGHIIKHASQTRVFLRKAKPPIRIARLDVSPHMPDGVEIPMKLTSQGFVGVSEKGED